MPIRTFHAGISLAHEAFDGPSQGFPHLSMYFSSLDLLNSMCYRLHIKNVCNTGTVIVLSALVEDRVRIGWLGPRTSCRTPHVIGRLVQIFMQPTPTTRMPVTVVTAQALGASVRTSSHLFTAGGRSKDLRVAGDPLQQTSGFEDNDKSNCHLP